MGEDGYLADKGLIPLPAKELAASQKTAANAGVDGRLCSRGCQGAAAPVRIEADGGLLRQAAVWRYRVYANHNENMKRCGCPRCS